MNEPINPIQPVLVEGMPAKNYHSDPCGIPSLSSSMAADFITKTPRHVWSNSRVLNPDFVEEESESMATGTLMHDLVLLGENSAELLDFEDFRKNEAKEARDKAIRMGKIPVLRKKWPPYEAMRKALFKQIAEHKDYPDALQGGLFEASLFWHEDGVNFRYRFDHVNFETGWVDDYKTTGTSIEQWIKSHLFGGAKDVQCEMGTRGYLAYKGVKPKGFRYVVQETYAPYCMAIVMLDAHAEVLASERLDWVATKWKRCLEKNIWPGYPKHTLAVNMPSWVESEWENWKVNQGLLS